MIGIKGWGAKKTPEEKAAARVARIGADTVIRTAKQEAADVARIEREKRKDAAHEAKEAAAKKGRGASIEKAIIKITDIGFLSALFVACLAAYVLDMIFFFQQSTVLWLSLLMCALGFIFRTIAICGGVMLEWAEEDEKNEPADPLDVKKARFIAAMRWVGRRMSFSTARMTLRFTTYFCWLVCVYATVSFFSSGHEMRKFALESATTIESAQSINAESVADDLRKQNATLDKDKQDIRADRDLLIQGARASLSELQNDGDPTNDNLALHEGNIARYNNEADVKIAAKDALIAANNTRISELLTGKGQAHVDAAKEKTQPDPSLAVYSFLASLTGFSTDGWTVFSAVLFALVFELIVDTGLKNYFRLKKGFKARLRRIELRQVVEDAEWDLNRFQTISAANLANARARAQAADAAALQERELADLTMRTERERARTEAAKLGVPWLDPIVDLNARQKLAEAENRKKLAEIEASIIKAEREAELLRNPPPPPPPPPAPPPPPTDWRLEVGADGLNEYQRMNLKSQQSKKFDDDLDDIAAKLKVPTEDWRNELRM
jgi:hypothetical protein